MMFVLGFVAAGRKEARNNECVGADSAVWSRAPGERESGRDAVRTDVTSTSMANQVVFSPIQNIGEDNHPLVYGIPEEEGQKMMYSWFVVVGKS